MTADMREQYSIEICDACAMLAANGEDIAGPDEPEPLGLIDPTWIVTVDCGPDGEGCSAFVRARCDGCGGLPGARHEATLMPV